MTRHRLPQDERLRLRSRIDLLFQHGRSFSANTLKVIHTIESGEKPRIKILVSVPRRKFKKAVFRNRIKRLMREAYRLNKSIVQEIGLNYSLNIAFIYTGDKPNIEYVEIEINMIKALNQLHEQYTLLARN
jgi:ribonuclease P protein component